ncbi:MAG: hypothetical protein LBE31_11115 [Deltaproteobacteria bacterium]|jgi:hypothetical protein|nr:hypothetical protein [Deltaproteobacteria bacterium]
MFKNLFIKLKVPQRAEIYSLLDFLLVAIGLVMELVVFLLLAFYPGQWLLAKFSAPQGLFWTPIKLLPMCLVVLLAVAPSRILRSSLKNGFGLDPRSAWRRYGNLAIAGLIFLAYLLMSSWVVFESILSGNLILWALVLLGCLWLYVLGSYFISRLVLRRSLRDITHEETPEGVGPFLEIWQRNWQRSGSLKVYDLFQPGLSMPFYMGSNVVVSGKALAAFTPEALKIGVVMAIMGQMLKLERNYLFMRLTVLGLAVPWAIIILHSLGFFLGFPLVIGPSLIPLIWLAVWLAYRTSNFLEANLKRFLCHKFNSAALTVTSNSFAIIASIGTMARYNLIPWSAPWWQRVFAAWPSPDTQVEKLELMSRPPMVTPLEKPEPALNSAERESH